LVPIIILLTKIKYSYYQGSNFIVENLNAYPILDIKAPKFNICPLDYTIQPLGESFEIYSNLSSEDYCIKDGLLTLAFDSNDQDCLNQGHRFQNTDSKHLLMWKEEYLCVKYLKKNYFDLLKIENEYPCPQNYKSCGILDTLNNKLCIPNEEKCPINYINIINKDATNFDPKHINQVEFRNFLLLFSNQIENSSLAQTLDIKNKRIVINLKSVVGNICALPHEYNSLGNANNFLFKGVDLNNCKSTILGQHYNPHYIFLDSDISTNFESYNNIYNKWTLSALVKTFSEFKNYNVYYTCYFGLTNNCKFNNLQLSLKDFNDNNRHIEDFWINILILSCSLITPFVFSCCAFSDTCKNMELDDDDEDCRCRGFCSFLFIILSICLSLSGIIFSWLQYELVKGLFFNLQLTNNDLFCSDTFTNDIHTIYYNYNNNHLNGIIAVGAIFVILFVIEIIFMIIQSIEESSRENGE